MSHPALIDGQKIAELRRLAGLSQRALARLLVVAPMTIHRIENGGGHGDLSMRFVDKLAAAIGVDIATLLPAAEEVEPKADDVVVEAALHELGRYIPVEELARALGWTLDRTDAALIDLNDRLRTTGLMLKKRRFFYSIGPRQAVVTEEQHANLQRAAINRWGLHLGPARVLRDALDGLTDGESERNAPAWRTLALGTLLKNRLARMEGQTAVVVDDVRFSLDIASGRRAPVSGGATSATRRTY
jgi:transcriptional regulator with XRE-family HTH domain